MSLGNSLLIKTRLRPSKTAPLESLRVSSENFSKGGIPSVSEQHPCNGVGS